MNSHHKKLPLLIAMFSSLTFTAIEAHAGGPALREIGTPASIGTAGALNPVNIFDASAAFTNPAGLSFIEGEQFRGGLQYLVANMHYKSGENTTARGSDGGNAGEHAPIPGFYVSGHFNDKWSYGLGLSGAFGGGLDYGNDFVGRYESNKSVLSAAGLTGSVSYRVNDDLSFGLGVSAIYTILELEISLPSAAGITNPGLRDPLTDGEIRVDEIDDVAEQFHLGMIYKINPDWVMGVVYHSEVESTLEGDVIFTNVTVPPINMLGQTEVNADIKFADIIDVGFIYSHQYNLKYVFEFDYENWDDFETIGLTIDPNGMAILNNINFQFKDTWRAAFSVMYHYEKEYLFAVGMSYDSSVVDDDKRRFDLPLDEQTRFSFAWGKRVEGEYNWSLAVSYIDMGDGKIDHMVLGERVQGKFDDNNLMAISASYNYVF